MNCYASHNYRDFSHAGNISKNFNEHIMQDMGFKNVALRQTHFHNKILGFFATLAGVCVIPFRLHKGDRLVLQYPIKSTTLLFAKWLTYAVQKSSHSFTTSAAADAKSSRLKKK